MVGAVDGDDEPPIGLPTGAGATRCAIDLDAAAWCWGANQTGQVGNGSTVDTYGGEAPYELPGRWSSVTTGSQGLYAGIYESDGSVNRALTANTNGIVLELLAYRLRGPWLRAARMPPAGEGTR